MSREEELENQQRAREAYQRHVVVNLARLDVDEGKITLGMSRHELMRHALAVAGALEGTALGSVLFSLKHVYPTTTLDDDPRRWPDDVVDLVAPRLGPQLTWIVTTYLSEADQRVRPL